MHGGFDVPPNGHLTLPSQWNLLPLTASTTCRQTRGMLWACKLSAWTGSSEWKRMGLTGHAQICPPVLPATSQRSGSAGLSHHCSLYGEECKFPLLYGIKRIREEGLIPIKTVCLFSVIWAWEDTGNQADMRVEYRIRAFWGAVCRRSGYRPGVRKEVAL